MYFARVLVTALACISVSLASVDSNIAMSDLQSLSHSGQDFTLSTRAVTDLWRKPPLDSNNAPDKTIPVRLSKFKRAQVTVSANWTRQYDQGGLLIRGPSSSFWFKAGIEFFNGEPCLGSVAAEGWSDWSVVPNVAKGNKITIEFAPLEGSIWLYVIDGEKRTPMREVTWFANKEADVVVEIGVYTARPTGVDGDDSEELVVHFENFELDVEK